MERTNGCLCFSFSAWLTVRPPAHDDHIHLPSLSAQLFDWIWISNSTMSFPDIPAASQRKWTNTPAHAQPETHANTYTPHPLFQHTHTHTHTHTHIQSDIWLFCLSLRLSLLTISFHFLPHQGCSSISSVECKLVETLIRTYYKMEPFSEEKKEGCAVTEEGGGGGDLREGNDAWWRRWEN